VNAAALAEYQLGALQGFPSGSYITVGTGIGAGIVANGVTVHGMLHPEVGHIRVRRLLEGDDDFAGYCPYHGDCLEGLAAGPAIQQRWGAPLSQLPRDHIAHTLIADYLGQACATLALAFSVGRIVIGGGVSETPNLRREIEVQTRRWLGGYLDNEAITAGSFIVAPGLGDRSGLVGALMLAQTAQPPQ